MLIGVFRLGCWLILNALLPDAVSGDVVQKYKDRFVKWPVQQKDDTANLIQTLKTIRSVLF